MFLPRFSVDGLAGGKREERKEENDVIIREILFLLHTLDHNPGDQTGLPLPVDQAEVVPGVAASGRVQDQGKGVLVKGDPSCTSDEEEKTIPNGPRKKELLL